MIFLKYEFTDKDTWEAVRATLYTTAEDGEVGRRPGVRLHVHVPLLLVESKRLTSARSARVLDFIDDSGAAVVTRAWVSFGILVRHDTAETLENGARREVLGRDELDTAHLTFQFFAQKSSHLWVVLSKRAISRKRFRWNKKTFRTTEHFKK